MHHEATKRRRNRRFFMWDAGYVIHAVARSRTFFPILTAHPLASLPNWHNFSVLPILTGRSQYVGVRFISAPKALCTQDLGSIDLPFQILWRFSGGLARLLHPIYELKLGYYGRLTWMVGVA